MVSTYRLSRSAAARWVAALFAAIATASAIGCGSGSEAAAGTEATAQTEAVTGGETGEVQQPVTSGTHADNGAGIVHLDSAALAMADIRVSTVEAVTTNALRATGTITYDANRVSHIGPKTAGRIVALPVDLGTRVEQGQVLAVLESAEVGATRADLHEAEALVEIARENYEREERLEGLGISSRKELLAAEAELRRTEAALQSAQERLRILDAGRGEGGEFAIVAPFDGVIVEKHATRGEVVAPSDQLFTVADLRRLWILLDIFERDLRRVTEGQPVTVTTAAYPSRMFRGHVTYVGDILDPEKRTVRARVEIDNTDGALKPGMFAAARIQVQGGAVVAAVPRDAVQNVEGQGVVWVPLEAKGEFGVRPVEIGESLAGGRIQILSGIEPGEKVVVAGAFTLKSELSKGEFGGHGH